MTRLYHPDLDAHIEVAHPKTVAVHKQSGWVDADRDPPPKSGAGSDRDTWAEYATSIGIEVDGEDTRDDIVTKVENNTAEEA